ncbi:carbohydrate kinase family protein [Streptomyces sp. NPDC048057]|uniref:carbohydrate kinase family protein n=1 Tax=Streptomyces sp. NPDC048057 TaxID=3155628 RepID=UPI00340C8A1E
MSYGSSSPRAPHPTPDGRDAPLDVLVVGGTGVDTVVRVPALPVPLADSVGVGPIREWAGQTGGYVALGCRALGRSVTLLDYVGDDGPGRLLREQLAAGRVDFVALHSPTGTRRAVNLVDAAGRRMSFYDARDPGGQRMPREAYLPLLRRARHVHLTITDFTRHLFDDVEEAGVPVSTDLHDWNGVDEHHREFALRAQYVFLSSAGTRSTTEAVMREVLRAGRARAVVATAGAAGSYVLTRDGDGALLPVPAVTPPAPVVDTNGAGDAYVSGFLHGLLSGRAPHECARLGARAGAHACTGEGGTALIGPAEIEGPLPRTG